MDVEREGETEGAVMVEEERAAVMAEGRVGVEMEVAARCLRLRGPRVVLLEA